MPKCEWREKPGAEALCPYAPQAGSIYCPRHGFLHNIAEAAKRNREANQGEAKRLGVGGAGGPNNRAALLRSGYVFEGSGQCKGCGRPIEWYRTPRLANAPYDPMVHDESPAVCHFITCPERAQFKKAS